MDDDFDERRGLLGRLSRLETAHIALDKRVSLNERDLANLKSTIDSRYDALHGGQSVILERMERFIPSQTLKEWRDEQLELEQRTKGLESTWDRVRGAYIILSALGIIGGMLTLVRLLKGT